MAQFPDFASFQRPTHGISDSLVINQKPLPPNIEHASDESNERENSLKIAETQFLDPLEFLDDYHDGMHKIDNREKPTPPRFGSFVEFGHHKINNSATYERRNEGKEQGDQEAENSSEIYPDDSAEHNRRSSQENNARTERSRCSEKKQFHGFISNSDFPNPWRKPENINVYATKKTIAQGMLDVALLAANATQLKNLLVVGEAYQFYIFALTLVCLSIALQIISGLLSLSLNFMRDRKMEDARYSESINWIGTARVALSFTVLVGILFIILGSMDISRRRDQRAAIIINDIILIGIFLISLVNVIIAGFNIDYSYTPPELSIVQGMILIVLGSVYDLNRQTDQSRARLWNDIGLAVMLLTVIINIIIASFALSDEH